MSVSHAVDALPGTSTTEYASVDLALAGGAYTIHIGPGVASPEGPLRATVAEETPLLVTNETVAPLHGAPVRASVSAHEMSECILPDGEQYKTLVTLERIYDAAVDAGCGRDTVLIALGGGVVGDVGGFAAATYQRGIGLVQVPTTLLAQVDASIGGKTGVNHPRGKNMIGAFYQPRTVLADTTILDTLPDREFRAGVAEIIKYGLLGDRVFFDWLETNMAALLARDRQALTTAIQRSCQDKAAVVAADEREHDQRALLNLGHTFAHAIEAGVGYEGWLHGEAVAVGLCMAADLSRRLNLIDETESTRIRRLVRGTGLPTAPPAIGRERMVSLMQSDKKARKGRLRFILLDAIGAARVVADVPQAAVEETLAPVESADGIQ